MFSASHLPVARPGHLCLQYPDESLTPDPQQDLGLLGRQTWAPVSLSVKSHWSLVRELGVPGRSLHGRSNSCSLHSGSQTTFLAAFRHFHLLWAKYLWNPCSRCLVVQIARGGACSWLRMVSTRLKKPSLRYRSVLFGDSMNGKETSLFDAISGGTQSPSENLIISFKKS